MNAWTRVLVDCCERSNEYNRYSKMKRHRSLWYVLPWTAKNQTKNQDFSWMARNEYLSHPHKFWYCLAFPVHGTYENSNFLMHLCSYSAFHKTFDKRFPKFVWNSWSTLRICQFHYVVVNQIVNFKMKLWISCWISLGICEAPFGGLVI